MRSGLKGELKIFQFRCSSLKDEIEDLKSTAFVNNGRNGSISVVGTLDIKRGALILTNLNPLAPLH